MEFIKKIKKILKNRNSFLRHVLTLTSATVVAQVITVVSSPIITRLYTPEEMGIMASLLSVVTIIGSISAGRYELAVVLPKNNDDVNAVVFTGIFVSLFIGVLISLIFGFFGDPLGSLLGYDNVPSLWLNLVGAMVFLIGIQNVFTRLCIRNRKFKVIAYTQASQQFGAYGVKIGVGFFKDGVTGLFLGNIIGHLIRTIILVSAEKARLLRNFSAIDFNRIKKVAIRYKKFPLVSSWGTLLNSASSRLPVVLFSAMFSSTVAGYFSLSHRILTLPMLLIGKNVGDVFFERAVKVRNDSHELSRLTLSVYRKLLFIGAFCLSFVTFYGDILFSFVFGPNWFEAGLYAQWISVWLLFSLASAPLGILFSVLERQGEGFIFDLSLFILRTSVISFGFFFNLKDITTIAIFASVSALFGFVKGMRCLMLASVSLKKTIINAFLIVFPVLIFQFLLSLFIRNAIM